MSSDNGMKKIVLSIGSNLTTYSQDLSASSQSVDALLHQMNGHISQRMSRYPNDPHVVAESGLFSHLCNNLNNMKNANHGFLSSIQDLVHQYERADHEFSAMEAMKGSFFDSMKKKHDHEIEKVSSRIQEMSYRAEKREESLRELEKVNRELNVAYHELKDEDRKKKSKVIELSCLNSQLKSDSEKLKKEISDKISSESSKIFSMRKMEKEMKEMKETIIMKDSEIKSLNEYGEQRKIDMEKDRSAERNKTAKIKEERDMLRSKRNDIENAFVAMRETSKFLLKKESKNQVTYLVSAVIEMKPNSQELGPLKELFDRVNPNSKDLLDEMMKNCVAVNAEMFDRSLRNPLERFHRYLQTERDVLMKNISSEDNSDGPYPASGSSEDERQDQKMSMMSLNEDSLSKKTTPYFGDFHSGGASVLFGSEPAKDEPIEIPILFMLDQFEISCRKIALIQVRKRYEREDPNKSRMIKEVIEREDRSELEWFMQGCIGLAAISYPAFKIDVTGMVHVDFGVLSGSGLSMQEKDLLDVGFAIDRRPQLFYPEYLMTNTTHKHVVILNNYFTKYPDRVDKESVENFCGKGWLLKDVTEMNFKERVRWSFLSRTKQI